MCQVIRELFPNEILIATNQGREEGRAEGRAEGRTEGREEGRKEASQSSALRMIKAGQLNFEQIALYSGLKVEEVQELSKLLDEPFN